MTTPVLLGMLGGLAGPTLHLLWWLHRRTEAAKRELAELDEQYERARSKGGGR